MVTFSTTFTEPSFHSHTILEVEYLKNGTSYGQSYYSTLKTVPNIWNDTMFDVVWFVSDN